MIEKDIQERLTLKQEMACRFREALTNARIEPEYINALERTIDKDISERNIYAQMAHMEDLIQKDTKHTLPEVTNIVRQAMRTDGYERMFYHGGLQTLLRDVGNLDELDRSMFLLHLDRGFENR